MWPGGRHVRLGIWLILKSDLQILELEMIPIYLQGLLFSGLAAFHLLYLLACLLFSLGLGCFVSIYSQRNINLARTP